jgi:hypothetical protein
LGKQYFLLEHEVTNLARGYKAKTKEIAACEKMVEVYMKTPSFGSSGDAFRQLYRAKRACRMIQSKMQRNQSVIALMQRSEITPVAIVEEVISGSKVGESGAPQRMPGSASVGGAKGDKPKEGGVLDGIASFFSGKEKKKRGALSPRDGTRPSSVLSSASDATEDLEWTDDEDDGADAAYMAGG